MKSISTNNDQLPTLTKRHLARFPKRTLKHVLQKLCRLLEELQPDDAEIVEATHQLRVASRKADVALRLLQKWLPRGLRCRLKSTLKRLRIDAGAVRDLDLLELRWRPDTGISGRQVSSESSAWLHREICDQRADAFDRLMRWTRRSGRNRFRNRSRQLLDRFEKRSTRRLAKDLSGSITKLIEAFRDAAPATLKSLVDSHRTRICARRLRYAVELLQDIIPDPVTHLISSLEAIQEQLGQINDDATANHFVRESLVHCNNPDIAASLQSWLDQSETAAMNRLAELSIQMPSPTQSLHQFLNPAD